MPNARGLVHVLSVNFWREIQILTITRSTKMRRVLFFLNKYPTQLGYTIISPKAHVEDLAFELSEAQYLDLQIKVHRIARVLKKEFDAERIYVLSLGSQEGNSHLHWHLVPLPRGVPYSQQQYHALMAEHGIIAMTPEEMARMAKRIGDRYRTALAAAS